MLHKKSLNCFQEVALLVLSENAKMLSKELIQKIFCVLMQQCTEKIDRTRAVAGSVFETLLYW